jgi:hypothetical protein
MNCPKCKGELTPFDFQGLNLDFCEECSGIWFEKGELAFYTETSDDIPDFQSALKRAVITHSACPQCRSTQLVETPFMDSSDLKIDICPSCQGIFLDNHELPKVEALSAGREVLTKVGRAARALRDQGYTPL